MSQISLEAEGSSNSQTSLIQVSKEGNKTLGLFPEGITLNVIR